MRDASVLAELADHVVVRSRLLPDRLHPVHFVALQRVRLSDRVHSQTVVRVLTEVEAQLVVLVLLHVGLRHNVVAHRDVHVLKGPVRVALTVGDHVHRVVQRISEGEPLAAQQSLLHLAFVVAAAIASEHLRVDDFMHGHIVGVYEIPGWVIVSDPLGASRFFQGGLFRDLKVGLPLDLGVHDLSVLFNRRLRVDQSIVRVVLVMTEAHWVAASVLLHEVLLELRVLLV